MAVDERVVKAGIGVVAIGVLLAGSRLLPGVAPGRESVAPAAAAPKGPGYRPAASAGALVHVAGAVRRPGVYQVGPDARVRDAVRRAGGAGRQADLDLINLAARVTDGQQVVVPRRPSVAAPGQGDSAAGSAPVSLGSATVEQLDGLDGVGPAIAQKIVDWRSQHGGFGSVDDLDQVPGIGPKKLEALRGQLTP